jgi:hypothetical protein
VCLALTLASLAPTLASAADEPARELRAPSRSKDAQELEAAVLAAIDRECTRRSARSSTMRSRDCARANGRSPTARRSHCRFATRAVPRSSPRTSPGVAKRSKKELELAVDFVVVLLAGRSNVELREIIGRQLAMWAVRRCAERVACLDAIAPTEVMLARHIEAVRNSFAGKATALASAERRGLLEVEQLTTIESRCTQATSDAVEKLRQQLNEANNIYSK